MTPYFVDISEILDSPGSSLSVRDVYPLTDLTVGDEVFALNGPARVDVTITNAGEGFVATGFVSADTTTACSRCLVEFPLTIEGEIEGFWVRPGADLPEDATGVLGENATIDIAEQLVAALVVEAPFAPVHDPACAGLCPTCGVDLNSESCDCSGAPDESHPFATLASLLQESGTQHSDE